MAATEKGRLIFITGPMSSGKTVAIILRLEQVIKAKQKFLIFKPSRDTSTTVYIESRLAGLRRPAIPIANKQDFLDHFTPDCKVVVFDEIHFFEDEETYGVDGWKWLLDAIELCINSGTEVIVSGLDMDFARRPFEVSKELLARADIVQKLKAVCDVCDRIDTGFYTQRWIDKKPAPRNSPRFISKGHEAKEASVTYGVCCRNCHRIAEDE